MKKKKILMLVDYIARTGFGSVSKNIVRELKKNFGEELYLHIVAINYFGEPFYEDENTFVISARKNDVQDDPYGRFFFLKTLKETNDFDGIFICQDLGVICPFVEVLEHIKAEKKEQNRKNFKSIFYFPADCRLVYELTRNLEFFDLLVTYTEYGRKEVLRFRPELKHKIKVIPHGNNSKDFFPLSDEERTKFRKEYFGENADKFIITNVNRNQPRKDIPNTIFGFIEARNNWSQDLPKPFLYLHLHPKDPMGWDIRGIMLQTDLKENVDYKLLPIEMEQGMAELDTLNKIYNASDVYLSTTLGEGWGLCLEPFTKINTSKGIKNIKDINVGDYVLGNSGNYHLVLDTTNRKVESIVNLKTMYGYNVKATKEHPYFVYEEGKGTFKRLSDIKTGDFVGVRKPLGDKKLADKIDLLDFCYMGDGLTIPVIKGDKLTHKYAYSPKNKDWSYNSIVEKYKTTKKIAEYSRKYIDGSITKVSENALALSELLIKDGYKKTDTLSINRYVNLDDDVLEVFGWYLAEGSSENGNRIEFSLSIDELSVAEFIKNVFIEKFGVNDCVIRKYETKCAVRISNKILAQVFRGLFGNSALNKKIPSFLIGCEKSLMPLIKGYIMGDGHINLSKNNVTFSTISVELAYQIQNILSSNGILTSIIEKTRKKYSYKNFYLGKIVNTHLRIFLDKTNIKGVLRREGTRNHKPLFMENETHFFLKIIELNEIKYEGEVFDLCVEGTHSFIGNGLVCHNTFSEAMSVKLPVVAPYSTSFIEMSNYGKNAYMLETLYPYCHTNDNVIREQTDIYEIADRLLEVATDKKNNAPILKQKVEDSYNWVKKLEWSEICKMWSKYFKETY